MTEFNTRESVGTELQRRINVEYERLLEENPGAEVCPHCGGLGYVGLNIPLNHPNEHLRYYFGKAFPCPCAGQIRMERQMSRFEKNYSLPQDHMQYTLDVWDTMEPEIRRGKEDAIAAAQQFAVDHFLDYDGKRKLWITFAGEPGKGKTSLACGLAMRLIESGLAVQWSDFNQLVEDVQRTYGDNSQDSIRRADIIEMAQLAQVLVLDDLGDMKRNAPVSDDKRDILYSVIRHRNIKQLPTIITTNLTKEQFDFQFGERIGSRVRDLSAWIPVTGEYLRAR